MRPASEVPSLSSRRRHRSPSSLPLSACWHVFVGRNFGCYVSHEAKKFIYFYVGQMGVVIFATA